MGPFMRSSLLVEESCTDPVRALDRASRFQRQHSRLAVAAGVQEYAELEKLGAECRRPAMDKFLDPAAWTSLMRGQ